MNEIYQCGEIHLIQAPADESTEVCRKSGSSKDIQLERINHVICALTENETGPSRVEDLWLWGPERTRLFLSFDKCGAERYVWEPGVNIVIDWAALSSWEVSENSEGCFSSFTSSPSYNWDSITKLHYDRLSSHYLSGQWSMDCSLLHAVDNLNSLSSKGVFTVTCSSESKRCLQSK